MKQEEYRRMRRDAYKTCRRKKRQFLNNTILQIEQDFRDYETRLAYKSLKTSQLVSLIKLTYEKIKREISSETRIRSSKGGRNILKIS